MRKSQVTCQGEIYNLTRMIASLSQVLLLPMFLMQREWGHNILPCCFGIPMLTLEWWTWSTTGQTSITGNSRTNTNRTAEIFRLLPPFQTAEPQREFENEKQLLLSKFRSETTNIESLINSLLYIRHITTTTLKYCKSKTTNRKI